ncbi:MAG: HAMP domain-containing histidine kinase, partial [Deltaproteobacteria bacterium]|nr:HAMP domain-containing histidine kinase [Deltaproteobacteria bacterium]
HADHDHATLDVNRLEAGNMPLDVEDFSLSDLLEELRQQIDPLPRQSDVSLVWQLSSDGPLRSDRRKIKTILRNLIINAIKFTDSGSIEITLKSERNRNAEFVVNDTGIGIPDDEISNIFGMFRQVRSNSRHSSGVGLGLYIVRRLIDLLSGQIDVQSRLGSGTTFRVRIPDLARDCASVPTSLAPAGPEPWPTPGEIRIGAEGPR